MHIDVGLPAAIVVRTLIVLVTVSAGLRLLGKRKLGELHLYDVMLILVISNAVQNSMTKGEGSLSVALLSAGTLLVAGWLAATLLAHHPGWEPRIMGTPTVLVERGETVWSNLRRERLEEREVLMAARQQGLAELSDVRLAVLEVDGTISVVPEDRAGGQSER